MENKQLGKIYYLKNPKTNEIFYVGATIKTLEERLNFHYKHLKEVQKGTRKNNVRFEYLLNLLPLKVDIVLIEEVPISLIEEKERYYITEYRKLYKLLNIQNGGKGGDYYTLNTEERKKEISLKISNANKNKKKPIGFSENLSITRIGINNPNAKELKDWIVMDNKILFKYGFEINEYFGNKYAYGNISKRIKKLNQYPYGHYWCLFSSLNKELQDIVRNSYESKNN